MNKNMYRCTRPEKYPAGTLGHKNPGARQGYYIQASSLEEAETSMKSSFPDDRKIDVELWRKGDHQR